MWPGWCIGRSRFGSKARGRSGARGAEKRIVTCREGDRLYNSDSSQLLVCSKYNSATSRPKGRDVPEPSCDQHACNGSSGYAGEMINRRPDGAHGVGWKPN